MLFNLEVSTKFHIYGGGDMRKGIRSLYSMVSESGTHTAVNGDVFVSSNRKLLLSNKTF